MALTAQQIQGLDALNQKIASGYKATAADQTNLAYAAKQGYAYKPPTFNAQQTQGLNAAATRQAGGTATPTDVQNLNYATNKGFKPTVIVPSSLNTAQLGTAASPELQTQINKNKELQAQLDSFQDMPQFDTTPVFDEAAFNAQLDKIKVMATPNQEVTQLGQELTAKQNEKAQYNLGTQKGVTELADTGNNLLTSQIGRNQRSLEHERSFKAQELSLDEANLISRLGLAKESQQAQLEAEKLGLSSMFQVAGLKQQAQDRLNQNKMNVFNTARQLSSDAQDRMAQILEAYGSKNPDFLTAEETAQLQQLAQQAGVPFELVVGGMRALNDEQEFKMAADGYEKINSPAQLKGLAEKDIVRIGKDIYKKPPEKKKTSGGSGGGYTPQELRKLRANGIDPKDVVKADKFLYGSSEEKDLIKEFDDRISKEIDKLAQGGDWGTSWNYIKNLYPAISNEQLDEALRKDQFYPKEISSDKKWYEFWR